jgi:hypothetical protein
MMLPNSVLEYNEERDAICSLELLAEHLPRVVTVPHHWKWVLLALHSSLQGFMVLSLQGTNALNVLTKASAEEWLEAYESKQISDRPPKLDAFMGLYSKIKSDAMDFRTDSKPFTPGTTQDESVRRLNTDRNDFVHFVPSSAILDMRKWAEIILDVIPIIEFLAFRSNNVEFHEPGARERVDGLCGLAKSEASALLNYYGAYSLP